MSQKSLPAETRDLQHLRIPQVAVLLGLGRTKVYALLDSGEIPSVVIGGMRLVPMAALRRMLERK